MLTLELNPSNVVTKRFVRIPEVAYTPEVNHSFVEVPIETYVDVGFVGTFLNGGWSFAPPAQAVTVPTLTMRQARLMLLQVGLLDLVDAQIDSIPDAGQRAAARITWEYSSEVLRTDALVSSLGATLNLTEEQIDAMFIAASAL
jgi:hypothetical protein